MTYYPMYPRLSCPQTMIIFHYTINYAKKKLIILFPNFIFS